MKGELKSEARTVIRRMFASVFSLTGQMNQYLLIEAQSLPLQ